MSTGLRERNKAKRRTAVLDAALELLDAPDAAPLTTERIAEAAEVSPATVYNLVGTREQLLVALVDRLIGELVVSWRDATPEDDPVAAMRRLIAGSVDVLSTRPIAHRRVILQLTAAANAQLHTKLSLAAVLEPEFRRAQDTRVLLDDLSAEALGWQVYLSYNGALLRWAAGALTDSAFKAAALHGLNVVLAASATPRTRRALIGDLRALGATLLR